MKRPFRNALIALVALLAGALPAIALAQSPFRDYGDAAGDQYEPTTTTTTPTSTTPPSTTTGPAVTVVVTTPVATVTAGSGGPTPPPGGGTGNGGNGNGNGGNGNGNGNGGNGNGNNGNGNGNGGVGNGNGNGNAGGGAAGGGGGGGGGAAGGPSLADLFMGGVGGWVSLSPPRLEVLANARKVVGRPAYLSALDEPVDLAALKAVTDGTRFEGAATDKKILKRFAAALGRSMVKGGPLAKRALPDLSTTIGREAITADDIEPVPFLILTHTDVPLDGEADEIRDILVDTAIKNAMKVKIPTVEKGVKIPVPVVGVENSDTAPSTMRYFQRLGVSTIDNIDTPDGQTSLANILAGATGDYGQKKTATDGKVAPKPTNPRPLLVRPSASYTPGDLLRDSDDGLSGGTMFLLVLLGLTASGAVLVVVERRTRRLRHR